MDAPIPDRFTPAARPFLGSEFPEEEFRQTREVLLQKLGFDLGMYKDRCIKRRIAIRVRALGLKDAASYVRFLREEKGEADELLAALTIHVSQFFRNPSTFEVLEKEILPGLLQGAREKGKRELRVWSVGCAGGEEPYSLALLTAEEAPGGVAVSILGTDISSNILNRAREGCYDPQRLAEVSEDLLARSFTREGRFFRISEGIRRRVTFRRHDILADGDFPDADLILCRNVLIYFSRLEQEKIFERFSRSLPSGGYLVLGKAETLLGQSRELFQTVNPAERIFRRQ